MTRTNPSAIARPAAPLIGRGRACAFGGPRTDICAFSMLELLTVMAIMVVVAAVAAPRFTQSGLDYRLNSAARRVLADLGQAQAAARAASTSRTITFDEANRSYSVAALRLLDGTANGYAVSLASEPFRIEVVSVDFAGTKNLTFDGFGQPASSGTIKLTLRGLTRTITVAAGSGTLGIDGAAADGGSARTPLPGAGL